jgi:hypothetical protein
LSPRNLATGSASLLYRKRELCPVRHGCDGEKRCGEGESGGAHICVVHIDSRDKKVWARVKSTLRRQECLYFQRKQKMRSKQRESRRSCISCLTSTLILAVQVSWAWGDC